MWKYLTPLNEFGDQFLAGSVNGKYLDLLWVNSERKTYKDKNLNLEHPR